MHAHGANADATTKSMPAHTGMTQQFSHPLASAAGRPPLPRLQLGTLVPSPTHVAYARDPFSHIGEPIARMEYPAAIGSVASSDEDGDTDSDDACSVVSTGAAVAVHASEASGRLATPVGHVAEVFPGFSLCTAGAVAEFCTGGSVGATEADPQAPAAGVARLPRPRSFRYARKRFIAVMVILPLYI